MGSNLMGMDGLISPSRKLVLVIRSKLVWFNESVLLLSFDSSG